LNRATQKWRREAIPCTLRDIDADVWVLTETQDSVSPGSAFRCIARSDRSPEHDCDESWVSIWSRLPLIAVQVSNDPVFSASATVALPSGMPLTIFGTVLPWRGRTWRGLQSADAAAFEAALDLQQKDWRKFTSATQGALCVAGDFNQDLSETPYYWSRQAYGALNRTLEACDLVATTAGEADPVRALTSQNEACVDHICVSRRFAPSQMGHVHACKPVKDGRALSDHPCIWLNVPGA
jgi:hypothetical protein